MPQDPASEMWGSLPSNLVNQKGSPTLHYLFNQQAVIRRAQTGFHAGVSRGEPRC